MRALQGLVLLFILNINPAMAGPELRPVVGQILPSHFRFKEIVPHKKPGTPGGWKAACVIARMNFVETVQNLECIFEVGVPQENSLGPVADEFAAMASATAANKAAYFILSQPPPHFEAVVCQQFRSTMETFLKPAVSGVRVGTLVALKKMECSRF